QCVLLQHRRMDVRLATDRGRVTQLCSNQLARQRNVALRFRLAPWRAQIRENGRSAHRATERAQILRREALAEHVLQIAVDVLRSYAPDSGRRYCCKTRAASCAHAVAIPCRDAPAVSIRFDRIECVELEQPSTAQPEKLLDDLDERRRGNDLPLVP